MHDHATAPTPGGPLDWAHPVVAEWFRRRFNTPTEPQAEGWPSILAGRTTLISAPTGSGKTLAAFLACIDHLVRQALDGSLTDRTEVVYVSPLKALSNDVQKNLDGPLAEIIALAREQGYTLPDIRTAVRTGDTLIPARQAMLRRPPHILVTTPESLFILLTSARSRENLRSVRTVIVDEIHAVADDKRGTHLALTLERLEHLVEGTLTRIGLSATQKPIELIAGFLAGAGRPSPVIVQIVSRRTLDLAVDVPPSELGPIATHEQWDEIYDRVAALVREHRSTLIFVNTRRLAERVTHHLAERLGADAVTAHHGSLSRKIRLEAERRLKAGDVRALVATASLELGIDIGAIELVCQIGSPRSIAVAVQRVGRAGHWRGAVPKGRFFPTTRDDLAECAALMLAMRRGELDKLIPPVRPIDVLAQQLVAMCAADDWDEDALFATVRRAQPYADLPREEFDEIVQMLADGIASKRGRYAAYLHRDRVNGRVRARRGARLAAITSGGAIPDNALYTVVAEPEGTVVGTVDEDFAVESQAGDVMLLGATSWRIRRVGSGRVQVEDAKGAAPSVPFWRGEAPARTMELSQHLSEVRQIVSDLSTPDTPLTAPLPDDQPAVHWLIANCALDRTGAEQLVEYIVQGRAVLKAVPTHRTVIAERFFDEGGGMQLVIHAPFGARINKAWGLALRKKFCRSFNFELQAAATDNGINIALAEQHSFPLADVFHFLKPATARETLEQAALPSPIFGTRWRWDAGRSLALLRFRNGKKTPIHILRMQSDDLLAAVFPDVAACPENLEGDLEIPNHPLVREVMKDVLTEAMDVDGFVDVLHGIGDGSISCLAVDSTAPSVFSHELLNANPFAYLDDAPLEERRARAVELRRMLPSTVLEEVGRLDPAAIAEVGDQAWPDVRSADDLHDALLTLVALPETASAAGDAAARIAAAIDAWRPYFDELVQSGRAGRAVVDGRAMWVGAERLKTARLLWPSIQVPDGLRDVEVQAPASEALAAYGFAQGWLSHLGPSSTAALTAILDGRSDGPHRAAMIDAVLRLEAAGWALRGAFRTTVPALSDPDQVEWCERRLLARIHRLTLGRLRREIAPVTAAEFMRWLLDWQHVSPGTGALGEQGLFEVVRQLQGYEAPANAWERHILARRVRTYDPAELDRLCLMGTIGWGRLSPHPATLESATGAGTRRVIPTSVAPITFFVRDDADWMTWRHDAADAATPARLSPNARDVLQVLHRAGASFFADIVRGAGHLKSEVEAGLWELVAAGLVTADGFDNLRSLIDPRRRAGHGSARTARPRHSAGRWALLHATGPADRQAAVESACWMLLRRYGVVFRELLARESNLPPWRDLLNAFRRLEDRGEIRGGRFISSFIGEQFALPIAVESLRAARHREPSGQPVVVAAADPLNLAGIIVPGERVAANSGRFVIFVDGVAVAEDEAALGRVGT